VLIWLAMPIRFSKCCRLFGQKKKGLALARPFVVALINPEA
jgi:hypothetical protein